MKRRIILILIIVFVIGVISLGITYYIRQNTGPRLLARIEMALSKTRDFDRAADLARGYIEDNPDDWQGYYYLGRAYMGSAAYEDARKTLDKAQELKPDSESVAILRSRTYSVPAGRTAGGARDGETFERSFDGFSEANKKLEEWLEGRRQSGEELPEEAEMEVQVEQCRILSDRASARVLYRRFLLDAIDVDKAAGRTDEAQKKTAKAAQEKSSIREDKQTAVTLLKDVFARKPSDDRAGRFLARICTELWRDLRRDQEENPTPEGRKTKAEVEGILAELDKLIQALPDDQRPPVTAMLLELYEVDDALKEPKQHKQKLAKAAAVLDGLIDLTAEGGQDRARLLGERARIALALEQCEDALRLCEEALEINGKYAEAQLYRAMAFQGLGRAQEAETEYRNLANLYPRQMAVQLNYAKSALNMGKPELARPVLRKILETRDYDGSMKELKQKTYRLVIVDLHDQGLYREAFSEARSYWGLCPKDPVAMRWLAGTAVQADQMAFVRSALEEAESKNPNNAGMLLTVGELWRSLRQRDKSRKALNLAVKVKPKSPNDQFHIARATIHLGRYAEAEGRRGEAENRYADAEKMLHKLQQTSPDHPFAYFVLGRLHEARGRLLMAGEEYQKAMRADPAADRFKVAYAKFLVKVGDLSGAEKVLDQLRRPDREAELLRGLIAIGTGKSPASKEAALGQGLVQYLLNTGQVDKCIEECNKLLLDRADETATLVRRILANAHLLRDERDKAQATLVKAIETDPGQYVLYGEIARILGRTQPSEKVEETLKGIPGARSEFIDLAIGTLNARKGDFREAAKCFRKVAESEDSNAYTRYLAQRQLVQSLAVAGETERALKETGKLSGAAPLQKEALMLRAQIEVKANRPDKAVAALEDLRKLALETEDYRSLLRVAGFYAALKKFDTAVAVCEQVIKLDPDAVEGYTLKAKVLNVMGKPDEAIASYRLAIQRRPRSFGTYVLLARLLDGRQQHVEALDVLKKLERLSKEGRTKALLARGNMLAGWGLHARAASAYDELGKMGYDKSPTIMMGLATSMARLGRKERAKEILGSVPKYAREYMLARLRLASLAESADDKLTILDNLDKARPGLPGVLVTRLEVLFRAKRYQDVTNSYETFVKSYGARRRIPDPARLFNFRALLHLNRFKEAAEFASDIALNPAETLWRRLAVLTLLREDPKKVETLLPRPQAADFRQAMIGLIATRRTGKDTGPWAKRVDQLDKEAEAMTPPRSLPRMYLILLALANEDLTSAQKQMQKLPEHWLIGRTAAAETMQFAAGNKADGAKEAAALLETSIALDMGLTVIARTYSMGVLNNRAECQWAVVLADRSVSDPKDRPKILEKMRPRSGLIALMVEGQIAFDNKDYEKMAKIYRTLSAKEKDNPALLRRLANVELLGDDLEAAANTSRRLWEVTKDDVAANNAASLMTTLWPNDKTELAEARQLVEAALDKRPDMAPYLDTLGWINHLLGDDEKALGLLRRAVRGIPNYVEGHAHVGIVEAATGSRELALWHIEEALDLAKRIEEQEGKLTREQRQARKLAQEALSRLGPASK